MTNNKIAPIEMMMGSIYNKSDRLKAQLMLQKLSKEDSKIYCNFYARFFSEFRHGGYIRIIGYFKDEEYDKATKLTGFSYKQLVELLSLLQKKDDDYLYKLFEFCVEIEKKQGWQAHGLLMSLDTKPEITEALAQKNYRKLLNTIIKDTNIQEDIEKLS
jgi:hypothetical protein